MNKDAIAVIIVGYRNAADVVTCLRALTNAAPVPAFDVYICENGGPAAFDALVANLSATGGPCASPNAANPEDPWAAKSGGAFLRLTQLRLGATGTTVAIGEAAENLGYAGGINAWLRPLLAARDWHGPGVWVLNPDTQPHPSALAELVAWAQARGKGMIGSRVYEADAPARIRTRGLRWNLWTAITQAVDIGADATVEPDPGPLEARLDAPSGASVYVTRACLDRVGLMEESYFLYFEDLEWGVRAKDCCGVGYAWRSQVCHEGGTTIGSAGGGRSVSRLAVYLDFRNRILFVRRNHPAWLAWTVIVSSLRCLRLGATNQPALMRTAFQGLAAGISGETGRPDHILAGHSPG
jgi:N-acetylglucosaminyl-diphospho-decaprenol L-rhamnosyltransferase